MDLNFKFGRTDYRYPLGVPVLLSSRHTGIGYLLNILSHMYIYFPNYQYLGIDDILQALYSFKELVQ